MRSSGKAFGVGLALLGGAGVALQSRINGELAGRVGSGFLAAVISFGTGLVIMAIATAVTPNARRGLGKVAALLRKGGLRWWECVGGAAGAFLVASQGITVGSLGVAVFIVSLVGGQSVSSLFVDRAGLAPGGPRPITPNRAIGTVLTVVAVPIAVAGHLGTPAALGLAVLPLLAGFGSAWQQAMNGRVRQAGEGVVATTFINFLVGTVALIIAFLISMIFKGAPTGSLPSEPWLYLGGTLGIIFIAIAAALVRHIGVLLLGLGMIAGQVIGAVLLDLILPVDNKPGIATYIGAGLTLVAVWIAALPRKTPTP
ncbi:DMT family transporter [Hamadaea tsunoensis]|uniref:DMT family transporter n=1 Tax=Hamadaea tsunoensis TaxID=53368 RepID=UPI00042A6DB3|nr:DMT family transporter [Hamadaea tsunoensis]